MSHIRMHWHCDAFVDNTSLTMVTQQQKHGVTAKELLEKMQYNGQVFEKSLWTSGGALNLEKCAWYLLVGTWEGTRFTWKQNKNDNQQLRLTSENNDDEQIIKKKNPTEAIRQLGVFGAPLGNMKVQMEVLLDKTKSWAI